MVTVTILRVDGREELVEVERVADVFSRVATAIGARTLDTVNLRDGRVMLVDDDGYEVELVDHGPGDGYAFRVERRCVRAKKPVNPAATRLYRGVCRPGVTHEIVGDVAIVTDVELEPGAEDEPPARGDP